MFLLGGDGSSDSQLRSENASFQLPSWTLLTLPGRGGGLVGERDESPDSPKVSPLSLPRRKGGAEAGKPHNCLVGVSGLAMPLAFPDTIFSEVLGCLVTAL